MSWILGRVLSASSTPPLTVQLRGEPVAVPALPGLEDAAPGALVLLKAESGYWRRGMVICHPNEVERSPFSAIPDGVEARSERSLRGLALQSQGQWVVDAQGHPCEVGRWSKTPGSWSPILNYAGWRLSDLSHGDCVLGECTVDGVAVLVLLPGPQREALPMAWSPSSHPEEPDGTGVEPGDAPLHLDLLLSPEELVWRDDAARFVLPPHGELEAELPESREAFDALKGHLAKEHGLEVRVRGVLGGPLMATTNRSLAELFEYARRSQAVATLTDNPDWVPLSEGRDRVFGPGGGSGGVSDVLGIEGFSLGARAEALRRLYERCPADREPLVWRGCAMLLPLREPTWRRVVWVWERPQEDNASYLFAPADEDQLANLRAMLAQEDFEKKAFLEDKERQRLTGFGGRIFHRDGTDAWWGRLMKRAKKLGA